MQHTEQDYDQQQQQQLQLQQPQQYCHPVVPSQQQQQQPLHFAPQEQYSSSPHYIMGYPQQQQLLPQQLEQQPPTQQQQQQQLVLYPARVVQQQVAAIGGVVPVVGAGQGQEQDAGGDSPHMGSYMVYVQAAVPMGDGSQEQRQLQQQQGYVYYPIAADPSAGVGGEMERMTTVASIVPPTLAPTAAVGAPIAAWPSAECVVNHQQYQNHLHQPPHQQLRHLVYTAQMGIDAPAATLHPSRSSASLSSQGASSFASGSSCTSAESCDASVSSASSLSFEEVAANVHNLGFPLPHIATAPSMPSPHTYTHTNTHTHTPPEPQPKKRGRKPGSTNKDKKSTHPPTHPQARGRKKRKNGGAGGVCAKRKRICKFHGCEKLDKGRGFCKSHGGGTRCAEKGCLKSARGGSRLCISHGGGPRCTVDGCQKGARTVGGVCKGHGGGRRCGMSGCLRTVRGGASAGGEDGSLCVYHARAAAAVGVGEEMFIKMNEGEEGIAAPPAAAAAAAGKTTGTRRSRCHQAKANEVEEEGEEEEEPHTKDRLAATALLSVTPLSPASVDAAAAANAAALETALLAPLQAEGVPILTAEPTSLPPEREERLVGEEDDGEEGSLIPPVTNSSCDLDESLHSISSDGGSDHDLAITTSPLGGGGLDHYKQALRRTTDAMMALPMQEGCECETDLGLHTQSLSSPSPTAAGGKKEEACAGLVTHTHTHTQPPPSERAEAEEEEDHHELVAAALFELSSSPSTGSLPEAGKVVTMTMEEYQQQQHQYLYAHQLATMQQVQ